MELSMTTATPFQHGNTRSSQSTGQRETRLPELIMQERWNNLHQALKAFHKRVEEDGLIARQIAAEIQQQFSAYIVAPDNRRVRVYKVGHSPTELSSYVEQAYASRAVEQTPLNEWKFGLGVLIGPDQFSEFLFRWPLYITLAKESVVVNFSGKKIELIRQESSYNCETLCALMYNSLMESLSISAGSTFTTQIGLISRWWP
jgi:hypothetical protein